MSLHRPVRLALALGIVAASTGSAGAVAFGRADASRDGMVTFEETRFVMPKLKEVSFNRFDTNKDGVIDRGEWPGLDAFYTFTYQRR
ncbi:hypothetical protein [Amaricoccus sp. W119]|uniref:hypothetical protein n=1 Tax=Amaricoccus sp. W119 TaxID=3391833 RepID=UPI0039A78716